LPGIGVPGFLAPGHFLVHAGTEFRLPVVVTKTGKRNSVPFFSMNKDVSPEQRNSDSVVFADEDFKKFKRFKRFKTFKRLGWRIRW
jgi:hypothetical protein